ncbi:HAD-IIB family hydrolase [Labrys monachus]|uniref:HAD superfamily hydrolase (TIGR01484 family) n=1 Tax=Labrys monachus TaxID=217067 RepID=A0ABU0F8Y5_9HYPH|nr:HAD-IIB family hydrolase [Labrys monachus]MDQ0391076.1 HAD superfamily hydrolase (TIGR01484 family) [Labrys monachus]
MYFLALATDYDGTIADKEIVTAQTCGALQRFKDSGRRLILVTGRELPDLRRLFPRMDLFDRVVAENGALLFNPADGEERLLAPPVPPAVARRLREMNVAPLAVGRVIVSTWEPHQQAALDVIRELGLELQISFNKGAVMILPPNVNKASGLMAAIRELDLAPQNVVAVGDAENDHAFLSACGCSAAVANALPVIKTEADIVLSGDHGVGVAELIDRVIREDAGIASKADHGILAGVDRQGRDVHLEPYRGNVLIVGPSACGKSTLATALSERMADKKFEFCIVDPEGDYVELEHAISIGNRETPPSLTEAIKLLDEVGVNLVVNLQALGLRERWTLFSTLLQQTAFLRARTGRPHWLVIDEAHEVLQKAHEGAIALLPPSGTVLITAYPQALARPILDTIDLVIALGDEPSATLAAVGRSMHLPLPASQVEAAGGEALFWTCRSGAASVPVPVRVGLPIQAHRRHAGKYAVGDVGPARSFYFHNPLNGSMAKAENLFKFVDVAGTIDDVTWQRHLAAGDYSAWFRHVIKDGALADETARIEADRSLPSRDSRALVRQAIWQRYAAPCEA